MTCPSPRHAGHCSATSTKGRVVSQIQLSGEAHSVTVRVIFRAAVVRGFLDDQVFLSYVRLDSVLLGDAPLPDPEHFLDDGTLDDLDLFLHDGNFDDIPQVSYLSNGRCTLLLIVDPVARVPISLHGVSFRSALQSRWL